MDLVLNVTDALESRGALELTGPKDEGRVMVFGNLSVYCKFTGEDSNWNELNILLK